MTKLIEFARNRNLYDLKYKARKLKDRYKRIAIDGGLAGIEYFACVVTLSLIVFFIFSANSVHKSIQLFLGRLRSQRLRLCTAEGADVSCGQGECAPNRRTIDVLGRG